MAISNVSIKNDVLSLINQLNAGDPTTKSEQEVKDQFAQGIADIIEDAIKSANVTIGTGLVAVGTSPAVVPNPAPIVLANAIS